MKNSLKFAALCAAALALFSCSNSSSSPQPQQTSQQPQQPQETQQPQQQTAKKTSDWLFLFYFDADDGRINDDLYKNIRDIECAFAQTKNADGTMKDGYASVTALVLWDGINDALKNQNQKYIHADGALYEIGPDSSLVYDSQSHYITDASLGDTFKIGPNTKDLTESARDWLPQEPNMADPQTFTNFLKWAKGKYSAQNVVVCLQDHGSGTGKETYKDSKAGSRDGVSGNAMISAMLCSDATNGENRMLTCRNITEALAEAGYTGADKPKILWNDLCLQATAEILWNYKGCADYYCASSNESWMPDYYGFFVNLKNGMSVVDVGKTMVSAYRARYSLKPTMPSADSDQDAQNSRASCYLTYTLSFMSLDETKVKALKDGVDSLADSLLAIKEGGQTVTNGSETLFNAVYTSFVKQDKTSLANCKGMTFNGSDFWLNDLGCLCQQIAGDDQFSAAQQSANNLLNLLKNGDDKLIVYAWGGKRVLDENFGGAQSVSDKELYLTGQSDFIAKDTVPVLNANDYYGLTIVGSSKYTDDTTGKNLVVCYDDWAGFSSKWAQVINAWVGL